MQMEFDMEKLSPRLTTIEELVNDLSAKPKCKIATEHMRRLFTHERLKEELRQ